MMKRRATALLTDIRAAARRPRVVFLRRRRAFRACRVVGRKKSRCPVSISFHLSSPEMKWFERVPIQICKTPFFRFFSPSSPTQVMVIKMMWWCIPWITTRINILILISMCQIIRYGGPSWKTTHSSEQWVWNSKTCARWTRKPWASTGVWSRMRVLTCCCTFDFFWPSFRFLSFLQAGGDTWSM